MEAHVEHGSSDLKKKDHVRIETEEKPAIEHCSIFHCGGDFETS
jgi:hypothetical protein